MQLLSHRFVGIEFDVDFSSECLSQLILKLQSLEGSDAVKNNANVNAESV